MNLCGPSAPARPLHRRWPEEAHAIIRKDIARTLGRKVADATRILYGGSVKPENAASLMSQPEIDGALVGGASLDPQSFAKIVKY